MAQGGEDHKIIELLPGDVYDIRCCEVFVTRFGFLLIHCSQCEAIYESFSQFVDHLLKDHKCNLQQKHMQDKHTSPDLKISEGSFSQEASSEQKGKFKCCKCDCTFKYGCQLKLHKCTQVINDIEIGYVCSDTSYIFRSLSERHVTTSSDSVTQITVSNGDIQNSECNLIEYNADELQSNEVEAVDPSNVSETTDDDNTLLAESLNPKENNEDSFRPTRPIRARPFPCTKCKHQYCDKKLLDKHYDLYHSTERRYKCSICEKAFTQKGNMTAHMRRHFDSSRTYECSMCTSKFYTRKELTKHIWRHTGERPYICDECGKRFISNSLLKDHMKRHTNEKPCKCSECDKSFYNVSLLRKHLQTHSSEYPHQCKECDSKFKSRKTLKNHIKLHLNKREYVCNICGAAFNQKPALLLHRKGKHKVIPITTSTDPLQT